jgi:class 3 adenylate cyclase
VICVQSRPTIVASATGLMMVGDLVGAIGSQEQTAVGETPNLAARLQALTEPGAVVVAPATRLLLRGVFELHDLGAHDLEGPSRILDDPLDRVTRTVTTRSNEACPWAKTSGEG